MKFISSEKYRNDIDGLRSIAVFSVILFHLGFSNNGYLGVDVFFVISGYLITGNIVKETINDRFSVLNFYKKRIRRILPLTSFVMLVVLLVGIFTMLPYNLEKLSRSIISTNFFGNNILQVIISRRYWDVMNEFEPLLHTWSLGVEEQYYLVYPFIFMFLKKENVKGLLSVLILLTLLSIGLNFAPFSFESKFFLLPFRFFELSIGGVLAILLKAKQVRTSVSYLPILALTIILFSNWIEADQFLLTVGVVLLTGIILATHNGSNKISAFLLKNEVIVYIGKISFSLYLWHQVVLAFYRYTIAQEIGFANSLLIITITVILSIFSYHCIEQPFRNKGRTTFRTSLYFISTFFILSTLGSYYVYANNGIVKDHPKLDYYTDDNDRALHSTYVDRVKDFDRKFESKDKTKVLVVGNSFARDWANVLTEWDRPKTLEISYLNSSKHPKLRSRAKQADVVFFSKESIENIRKLDISMEKVWCVGTKNFGVNNGIFYNYKGEGYCLQRTRMEEGHWKRNEDLKQQWGKRYIDLISMVIDENNNVPVFTNNCKFISHDSRHFTPAGAKYFSRILDENLNEIVTKEN